ncbi:MAG TPA: carbamoyltransferase C-terminal domain-containing protein [Gemmataceae bacterium]|nr:carbamoyltransferase C-terminal domain-containing protein [Gemmataceae bacterium]
MIILGINDGHDSGVCLLRDGQIVLCSSEERRLNIKNHAGIPEQSIAAVFTRTGISPADVDLVTLSSCIRTTVPTRDYKPIYSVLNLLSSLGRTEWGTRLGRWLLTRLRKRKDLLHCLAQHGMADKPVLPFDHHLCHAATAYYHRPWSEPATVLTMDGAGDGLCATVNTGRGLELEVVARTPKFHSLAAGMYSAITAHLGLKPYEHEYKVMGMAPYGQAEYCADVLRRAFAVDGLKFRNRAGRIASGMQRYLARRLYAQRFDNVAAACQLVFEELMLEWVRNAVKATGIPRLTAAGGAFLNVKANKLIREMPEVEALYVYPASDDGGTPVGAAVLGYLQLCKQRGVTPKLDLPRDMYLGLEFSDSEMEAAARASGFPYRRMADPAAEIAGLLADGKIVARFSGREELGPRALGNRSIFADPRDLRVIRKLNFAIKQRDFWMPFAASVLEEDACRYIQRPTSWAYYMIEAFDTTPEGAAALVAGTHPFDQTIRPQLVNDLNPGYRDLLRAFRARTGVGGLLNTSFNLHGYPIVGTPEVALDTLKKSDLDAVALGPILVTKPPH